MRRRIARLLGLALALGLLAGCADASGARPPAIRYGQDVSEHGMIISDPRFAAAALPERGEAILFDDIGELLKYHQAHPQDYRALYVNGYLDKQWLRAEEAWYLQSRQIRSPMGWGLAAFADEPAARRVQGEFGGEILTWTDVLARDWSGPPPGP
jgi:copper chaperone NosL